MLNSEERKLLRSLLDDIDNLESSLEEANEHKKDWKNGLPLLNMGPNNVSAIFNNLETIKWAAEQIYDKMKLENEK